MSQPIASQTTQSETDTEVGNGNFSFSPWKDTKQTRMRMGIGNEREKRIDAERKWEGILSKFDDSRAIHSLPGQQSAWPFDGGVEQNAIGSRERERDARVK